MKNKLIKIIGYNNYKTIVVGIYRTLNNFHKKIWFNNFIEKKEKIKDNSKHIFFGYYDYPSIKENSVLYLSTSNDTNIPADICIYDLINKTSKKIAKTNSWNMQMGARLRWLEDNIIFNFYDGEYKSQIINKSGKILNTFNFPVYDISNDNQYAFYCNFSILNTMRPGYGYTNTTLEKQNVDSNENGIYRGELSKNEKKLILSIQDIKNYQKDKLKDAKNHYINHICCSKFSNLLMFFHLWEDKNKSMHNRVFIITETGEIINVIDDFDRASHYSWKNENEILLTILKNNICEYRLYNIKDNTYKKLNFIQVDGHPSYISEDIFITDTYPDHNGMQHIYLCNENGIINEICEIYHNPRKNNEYRCDLHPRYESGYLTFDCNPSNYREQMIIKVDLLKKIKYSDARAENKFSRKLYMFLCNKIDVNPIKYLYFKNTNFSYKAHLLVYKMMHTKSKLKKTAYFNKLQKKYSMWISPDCKIGENNHFMHLDGICIGSGVEIGNNCTIYHQVTLGKEKGKFPTIGNNVTIFSGAKILGGISIGDNSVIGANAVVIKDVPENSVAVGIPARNIKRK